MYSENLKNKCGKILILVFLVFSVNFANAEIIGNPPYKTIKIPISAYGNHFDMAQDKDNTLYIAYVNGIKIFDGASWQIISIGDDSSIRRLYYDGNERVYYGGDGLFGYLYKDDFGVYHNKDITPANYADKFGSIWHIIECNNAIIFISLNTVFKLDKQTQAIKNWDFNAKRGSGFCYQNKLIIQDRMTGLVELNNEEWIPNSLLIENNQLIERFEYIDEDNIFLLSQNDDWRVIQNNKIKHLTFNKELPNLDNYVSIASLTDGKLVLGSNNGLLTFIDVKNLQAQSFQLTNEWISKIIRTDNNELIILTEFEIFYMQWPSALRIQGKDTGLASRIMDVTEWNDNYYVASSAGVFLEDKQQRISQHKLFRRLEWTNKEAWVLLPINEKQILLAESHKLFLIENNETEFNIEPLSDVIYPRVIIASQFKPNLFYIINEFDVQLLYKSEDTWELKPLISQRPTSLVEEESGSILASLADEGLYQIKLDLDTGQIKQLKNVSEEYNLDSVYKFTTSLFLTKNKAIYAYNSQGIYKLEDKKFSEIKFPNLLSVLKGDEIINLTQDDNGLFYGYTHFSFFYQDNSLNWKLIDLSQHLKSAIGNLKIFKDEIKILSNGIIITYYINNNFVAKPIQHTLRMTKVEIKENDGLKLLSTNPQSKVELDHTVHSITFTYVLNNLKNHDDNQYRFKLLGEKAQWSGYSPNNQVYISDMDAGEYSLSIQAKDINQQLYTLPSYHFVVKPLWYYTLLAKIIWIISALLLLGFFIYKMLKFREYSHELQKQSLKNIIDNKTKKLQQANINLQKMAHLDGLTGLSNRFYLDEYINKLINKDFKNIIVMMMDMDEFKQYNDLNGHIEGDELLKTTAQHLLSVINDSSSIIARYGGEEFLVILMDCPLDYAQKKAEDIRQLIENKDKRTSISIGVCESSNQLTLKSIDAIYNLIDQADQALYSAKNQGRNRIVICD